MAVKILSNGKWYKPGRIETIDGDGKYLDLSGQHVRQSRPGDNIASFQAEGLRHPLTECEPPKAYVLGVNAIASAEEKDRPSITGEFHYPKQGEDFVGSRGGRRTASCDYSTFQGIILSPPAPDPKTAEELLIGLQDTLKVLAEATGECLVVVGMREEIQAARKSLAAQPENQDNTNEPK